MKILIRNLARSTTSDQILKLLKEHADVHSFNLVLDADTQRSKGFGFAEIKDKKSAIKAIKALNNKMVDGMKIRVKSVK